MKKISPLNYAFSVGKIRTQERFLIRQAVFEEAIDSDLNEALRLIVESNLYSDALLHIKNSRELETFLNQELIKLKTLMNNLILDKSLLELMEINDLAKIKSIVRGYESEFLEDYLNHLIDLHNIKTFLRLYILKEPQERLKIQLTTEGFIKKEALLKLYPQDLSVFLYRLEYVHKRGYIIDYASFLREAIQNLEKESSFVLLEKAIQDFLIQALRPAKYLTFGPEPVLAYYFAKRNEINLVRMIILAKLNKVSPDLVKERLNAVYA